MVSYAENPEDQLSELSPPFEQSCDTMSDQSMCHEEEGGTGRVRPSQCMPGFVCLSLVLGSVKQSAFISTHAAKGPTNHSGVQRTKEKERKEELIETVHDEAIH